MATCFYSDEFMNLYLMRHYRINFNPVVYALGVCLLFLNSAWAMDVTLVKIDGTISSGEWLGSSENGSIQIKSDGQIVRLHLYDVTQVRFDQIKKNGIYFTPKSIIP